MKSFLRVFYLLILAASTAAQAVPVTFNGNNGTQGASATFDIVGSTMTVTLAATTGDVLNPAGVLTTVFFNLGGGQLTPVSALVAPGSVGVNGAPNAGGNVGGEWAYATGFSQYGANSGISSTGLGLFPAGSGNFNGPDLDGTGNGSPAYGLLTAADNFATGNPQVTAGGLALNRNSVVFTLGNVTGTTISNVTFQWGTSLTEPSAPGIGPGPGVGVPDTGSTLILLGVGLSMLLFFRKRAGSW